MRRICPEPSSPAIDQFRFTASFHRQKEGRNELLRDATERRQRFDTGQHDWIQRTGNQFIAA